MMSKIQMKKLRTLQDIKLEKARLKYEMLVAENNLGEDLHAVERVFTFSSTMASITKGISVAKNVYDKVNRIIEKLFGKKRKKKSREEYSGDE